MFLKYGIEETVFMIFLIIMGKWTHDVRNVCAGPEISL